MQKLNSEQLGALITLEARTELAPLTAENWILETCVHLNINKLCKAKFFVTSLVRSTRKGSLFVSKPGSIRCRNGQKMPFAYPSCVFYVYYACVGPR